MMWFLFGFIVGGVCGFCWPVYVLREVCTEFEELRRAFLDLESRDLKLRQRFTLDNRKAARRIVQQTIQPSRN